MSNLLAYLIAIPAFAAVVAVGIREHRMLRASRRNLLDRCLGVLNREVLHRGNDDFPSLTGYWRGSRVDVHLIPDTMTIRRLPQLWLSATWLTPVAHEGAFAALVRYSGYEFYSLTSGFDHRLEPTPGLPPEIVVRGEDATASRLLLERLQAPLADIFSDPLVKEVAVTRRGFRIIRQAGEGRRGEHLLLRQAIFDEAQVHPSDLERTLEQLDALRETITTERGACAA